MFFTTPLLSVLFVAQLLVAVLAVPAFLLDSAIEARSLEARAPVIKFHVCTNIHFRADCYYLATEPLTIPLSNSGCVNLKAEVASNIESVRVLDTWNYAVSLYDDISCSGPGVSILDSDEDLGEWKNRAKSARVFYYPVPHDSYTNNAV